MYNQAQAKKTGFNLIIVHSISGPRKAVYNTMKEITILGLRSFVKKFEIIELFNYWQGRTAVVE